MRGVGEGQRPWDVKPEGVMTNATVGTVSQTAAGGIVHVSYKDGESEYVAGPDVPVLAYVLADCRGSDDCGKTTRRQFAN